MSLRTPLIAGNWKMNGSLNMAQQLCSEVVAGLSKVDHAEVLICPPHTLLYPVNEIITGHCQLGAQDVDTHNDGAFTGQVSTQMLLDSGCQYVILGHSERRQLYGETDALIADKVVATINAGLTAIVCVGESQQQREANQVEKVIGKQLESVIEKVTMDAFKSIVIAYEPIWAIGTGLTATPEQAQQVHHFIRQKLRQSGDEIADQCRIIYGGSMKPENAKELLNQPDIDGGLIGGAALNAAHFLTICQSI